MLQTTRLLRLRRNLFDLCDPCHLRVSDSFDSKIIYKRNKALQRVSKILLMPRRGFSDNLLGYSPMAPQAATNMNKPQQAKPHVDAPASVSANNSMSMYGAPLSSKQGKLAELRLELKHGKTTLEDAATPDQRLDLNLVEGIALVAKAIDQNWAAQQQSPSNQSTSLLEFENWLLSQERSEDDEYLDQSMFQNYLLSSNQMIDAMTLRVDEWYRQQGSQSYYSSLPDFIEKSTKVNNTASAPTTTSGIERYDETLSELDDSSCESTAQDFDACCIKLRLIVVKAAIQHLSKSWDTLTALTDADVDRAAIRGDLLGRPLTLSKIKLRNVLCSFTSGTCVNRMEALWNLIDHDQDGFLEQEEMANAVRMSMKPVEEALKIFLTESILHTKSIDTGNWRQRRQKRLKKEKLEKMFLHTIKNHFEIEIESAHRLRCIYAWADKKHQGGKISSTLVAGGGLRQRYVELNPKISFEEFRIEQKSFFPQLDRVGEEIMKGYKDDLLLLQGTGRQNQELKRDCISFFAVVSVIDFALMHM